MMATRIRKRIYSALLICSWLFLLPGVMAGEAVSPGPGREMGVPNGEALPPPVTVRSMRYEDNDSLPFCLECPTGTWVTVLRKTITTNPTTSYLELDWTGQFTVVSTNPALEGIRFRAGLIQNSDFQFFPGAGDDNAPYVARCDFAGIGPQWFGGYHGMLLLEPDTSTTVVVQVLSTAGEAYACFQNVIVRYD
jgi:hypothetical protein